MAPKNKKKNSFYFFMKEIQDREAAKGTNIPMHSLAAYAHPLWVKLTPEEKEHYEELARQFKNNPSFRGGKMAGDGTLVEDNARQSEEDEKRKIRMKQSIKRYIYVDCVSKEHFKEFTSRKVLYFISFNILCHTETCFIPIEVGIVEYSISSGIHREMQMLIHSGSIPTGFTGQAKRLLMPAEDVHNIDIFRAEKDSERNMTKVYDAIQRFVNPSDENPPPLFCIGEDIEKNKGCLDWLAEQAGDVNNFEVWDAAYLLEELREGVDERLPSVHIANDLLTKTCFDYHSQSRCEFHDEKDCSNCALAYCKRLCYLLSDAVCPVFDVTPTESHIPNRADEEKAYVVIDDDDLSGWRNVPARRLLDKKQNYYENKELPYSGATHSFPPAPPRVQAKPPPAPRQPTSVCLAEDMNRLKLNLTSAPVPGQGIGRGRRWK